VRILVLGVGNLLLSDEGFGVHFVRYLERHYEFPNSVELFDAGTLGLMAGHKIEEADWVYIVDVIVAEGAPGEWRRYSREDLALRDLPVKISPHQVGVQEMLMVSELRGRCPKEVCLLGVVPASMSPGTELSAPLRESLGELAHQLIAELQALGIPVRERASPGAAACQLALV